MEKLGKYTAKKLSDLFNIMNTLHNGNKVFGTIPNGDMFQMDKDFGNIIGNVIEHYENNISFDYLWFLFKNGEGLIDFDEKDNVESLKEKYKWLSNTNNINKIFSITFTKNGKFTMEEVTHHFS